MILDEFDAAGGKVETAGADSQCHPIGSPNCAAVVMLVNDEMMNLMLKLAAAFDTTPTMIVHQAIVDYVQRHRGQIEQKPIFDWMLR